MNMKLRMRYVPAVLAFLLLPLSVWAMTPMADNELDAVSGQTGVSILPNITMNIHFDVIAWGDADGIGGSSAGGYVGVKDLSISGLSIGMRTDDEYAAVFPSRTVVVEGKPLTVYDTSITLENLRHPFNLN
jgi:hypothetical protein